MRDSEGFVRMRTLQCVVLFVFLLIGGRLAYIQLVDSRYNELAKANVLRHVVQYPPRGEVFDRNGEYLVQSRECYDLMVIYSEIDKKGFDTLRMCEVLGLSREKLEKELANARMRPRAPRVVTSYISKEDKLRFDECNFRGFYAVYRTVRRYPRKVGGNLMIIAGIIIIPSCFAYGIQPDAGPSLLFITLPNVFRHMPGGRVWETLFFIFMTFAALSTVIAVFENIIAITMEIWNIERKRAVKTNMVMLMLLSMPAVLGYNLLSGIQPMGAGTTIMDLEDFLVSYNILPLGGLVFVLFCTKKNGWGFENFRKEVNTGVGFALPGWIRRYMSYVLPLIIILVYLKGYYDMFSSREPAVFLFWMLVAVAFLLLVISFSLRAGKRAGQKKQA